MEDLISSEFLPVAFFTIFSSEDELRTTFIGQVSISSECFWISTNKSSDKGVQDSVDQCARCFALVERALKWTAAFEENPTQTKWERYRRRARSQHHNPSSAHDEIPEEEVPDSHPCSKVESIILYSESFHARRDGEIYHPRQGPAGRCPCPSHHSRSTIKVLPFGNLNFYDPSWHQSHPQQGPTRRCPCHQWDTNRSPRSSRVLPKG